LSNAAFGSFFETLGNDFQKLGKASDLPCRKDVEATEPALSLPNGSAAWRVIANGVQPQAFDTNASTTVLFSTRQRFSKTSVIVDGQGKPSLPKLSHYPDFLLLVTSWQNRHKPNPIQRIHPPGAASKPK
jgi:hypothetical protein